MINEYLNEALGEISQEKIAEATNIKKTKKIKIAKIAAAACIVLVAAAVAALVKTDKIGVNDVLTENQLDAEQTETAALSGAAAAESTVKDTVAAVYETESEIFQVKTWDEKENIEKYTELVHSGKTYCTTGQQAEESQAGEKLGSAKCIGYDEYTEQMHESACEVFEIGSFDSDFLVAVKFDGDDGIYTYKSRDYFPSDLGDFTQKLNFSENITVDGSFMFTETDELTSTGRELLTDSALSALLFGLLEKSSASPAEKYENGFSERSSGKALEFGVYSPLLSQYSLSLVVTDDGYIRTNLIDTGVAFFVGVDAVKPLFDTAAQLSLEQETTAAPPYELQQYTGTVVADGDIVYPVTEIFSQPRDMEE